eukprot:jgi/Bigna1/81283/fgenesh1_pg.79_\
MGQAAVCCVQCCIAPTGVQVSTSWPKDPFKGQVGWDEKVFRGKTIIGMSDEKSAKIGFERFVKRVRLMEIFCSSKVYFPEGKSEIELDMQLAFAVPIDGYIWTSLERFQPATLTCTIIIPHHVVIQKINEVCISAELENIVDGYYRIVGVREGKTVTITFDKIQTLNGRAIRALSGGKMRYETENAKFAQDTADYLATHLAATGDAGEFSTVSSIARMQPKK